MIFIKNYINKKNSLQNIETIHNDWNINTAFILNLPMIPNDVINFLRRKYSSSLYLYNFYINTKDINTKNINILNYNTVYYQYTPQILDNILYNNHYKIYNYFYLHYYFVIVYYYPSKYYLHINDDYKKFQDNNYFHHTLVYIQ